MNISEVNTIQLTPTIGNIGIGTSSPTAKLDVSGLIKTDHLSLGIHQYPNVGGQWLTINLNTYNANAGPNAPEPEGGIMFSNIDANSIFKWGYYMGVVKPSASDQSNSQRLDIGRTIDVESQISGGTVGTFIPSVTVFNDKVGIGTTSPAAKLDIGGNTDGQVQAILTRGNDPNFQLQAINSSGVAGIDIVVSKFGLRHGTNETALFNFIRGSGAADGSLAIVTNNTERMRVNSGGYVGIGTSSPNRNLVVSDNTSTYIKAHNTSNDNMIMLGAGSVQTFLYSRKNDETTPLAFSINQGSLGDTFVLDTSGNVGIGTTNPYVPLQIGKGSSGSTRAILATANDSSFNIKVVEQSSSNATGAYQGDFGLYHGNGESFVLRFRRGGAGNDGGLSFYTNWADRFNFISNGDMTAGGYYSTSDDRLKIEETLIKNGLEICMKLSPQFYTKKDIVESTNETLWKKESGFIAQEIYYDIPELRHIVILGNDANPLESIKSSSDPSIDPDYSSWGTSAASVNYVEIIPYTVSAIQEINRRQTMDNERILELENENATLQGEVNTLKQQMAMVMEKLGL